MQRWLAAAAVVPAMLAAAAHAQMKTMRPAVPTVDPARAPDLKLPPDMDYTASTALQRGMIAEEDLAPNALIGVGLANMSGRKATSLRLNEGPVATRNPGVSFVLKF